MAYYRLYHLDPFSGRIDRAEEIDAADDIEALALARASQREADVELWQEHRKVHRLEALPDLPPGYTG